MGEGGLDEGLVVGRGSVGGLDYDVHDDDKSFGGSFEWGLALLRFAILPFQRGKGGVFALIIL